MVCLPICITQPHPCAALWLPCAPLWLCKKWENSLHNHLCWMALGRQLQAFIVLIKKKKKKKEKYSLTCSSIMPKHTEWGAHTQVSICRLSLQHVSIHLIRSTVSMTPYCPRCMNTSPSPSLTKPHCPDLESSNKHRAANAPPHFPKVTQVLWHLHTRSFAWARLGFAEVGMPPHILQLTATFVSRGWTFFFLKL